MSQQLKSLITGVVHTLEWTDPLSPGFDFEHDPTVPKAPEWMDRYLARLASAEVK